MTVNDPTAQDPLAQNTSRARSRRLADVIATIVLLTVHVLLFGATIMLQGLLVMNTDSCSGQTCGDPAWLDRGLVLSIWAGGAMLFADLAVAVLRLARQRVAWFVPLIGCVAQLALAFSTIAMGSLAGPIS